MRIRKRETPQVRERKVSDTPKEWPNGSGLYRKGMAGSQKGLLGRTVRFGSGKVRAWRYLARDKYSYLGEFKSDLDARLAIRNHVC